ncbi:glycosyltransferase family 2 protein [Clostridium botulinum]|nr:glycosyltransferase family 2 protein [Clostridium botulinum]
MSSLVSLMIPCYNGEKFIDQCVNSILLQTYDKVEVIFINDGSKDNTENKILEYKKSILNKGYNFIYIYQENAGAAAAINTGLKDVTGSYIMLFDIDDILMNTAIEEKAEFLDNNKEYDMVRNNGYYVNVDDLDKILGVFIELDIEKNNKHIFTDLILGKTNNWTSTFMVRTESLFKHIKNKSIYVSQYGQNLQIMLPVAYYGKTGFIDKPLMKYVNYKKSHSTANNIQKKLDLISGYEKNRIEIINMMDIDKKEKAKYINEINVVYFKIRMDIAYEYGDMKLLKGQYGKIKDTGNLTNKDILKYYCRIFGIIKIRDYMKKLLK